MDRNAEEQLKEMMVELNSPKHNIMQQEVPSSVSTKKIRRSMQSEATAPKIEIPYLLGKQILNASGGSQKLTLEITSCLRNIDPTREPILLCSSKVDEPFAQKLKEALQNAGHYVPLLLDMDDNNLAAEFLQWAEALDDINRVLVAVMVSRQCSTSFLVGLALTSAPTLPLFYNVPPDDCGYSALGVWPITPLQRSMSFAVVNFHMYEDDLFIKDVLFHVSILRGRDLAEINEPITKEIDKIFQMMPATEARVLELYGSGVKGELATASELMVNSYAQTFGGRCALIDFSRSTDCNAKEMVNQYNTALHRLSTIRNGSFCPIKIRGCSRRIIDPKTNAGLEEFLRRMKRCMEATLEHHPDVFLALDKVSEENAEAAQRVILQIKFSSKIRILVTSEKRDVLAGLLPQGSHSMPFSSFNPLACDDPLEHESNVSVLVHSPKNISLSQGLILKELGPPAHEDLPSKALSGSVHVETPSFKGLQPTMSDAQSPISTQTQVPTQSISLTASSTSIATPPIIGKGELGSRLLLRLEGTCLPKSIPVGVVVHEAPSEMLEFVFFDVKDMATCVGVGLPQAIVILHEDLNISIEQTSVIERELDHTWRPLLSDDSCHWVMNVEREVPGIGDEHGQAASVLSENGETDLQSCGVGFNFVSQYVDEIEDATVVSWPVLYDMALFVLIKNDPQCSENEGNSSAQGSGSFQGNIQNKNNMRDKLQKRGDNVSNGRILQDKRQDNDDDGSDGNQISSKDDVIDEKPPIVLKVTVLARKGCHIVDELKTPGLDHAAIAPILYIEFRQKHKMNRISIRASTQLGLGSTAEVRKDENQFGWYHQDIDISLGCDGGQEDSGRLEPNSCRILNTQQSEVKYTTGVSRMSTRGSTRTVGGQGNINILGTAGLHGSCSGSGMNQESSNASENIESTDECICKGFHFVDESRPARAHFRLSYPLQKPSIWENRQKLAHRGLFSTIVPSIKGTWIPIQKEVLTPYSFKVQRDLILQKRENEYVTTHKQEYTLLFFVNHAMTHLRNYTSPMLLDGNQQEIPHVILIATTWAVST